MPALRRLLPCLLLLALPAWSGCEMFSSDAWQRPSPLSGRPPPPPERHERAGGFSVLVGLPGQPTAARVVADIGTFAQGRGFVRSPADAASPNGPERYLLGDIHLDVLNQTADLRVTASLHGFKLNRRFVDGFYQDFRRQYAGGYGEEASLVEADYAEDAGFPSGGPGGPGGQRGGGARAGGGAGR